MTDEKMRIRPNLARIAAELASYGKDADRVVDGLAAVLTARTQRPAEPAPAAVDNNQLNRCRDLQGTFNALVAFAEVRKEAAK